jgi:pimeloyl-ACP methyl ester carboxylesterase
VKVLEGGGWQLKHLKRSLEELKGAGPRKDLLPVLGHGLGGKVSYVCQALLPEGSVSFERLTALLPAHESWMLLEHLAGAMAWLHGRGVVHAGLSSWNVFVAAGADDEPQVPSAELAVMGPQGAVEILYKRELQNAADPVARRAELVDDYTERFANPYAAAERGFVDDVIDPAETRIKVIAGLEMLKSKREELPHRKHGNIPL